MRPDLWNILEPVHVDPRRKSWKDVLRNLVYHANVEGCAWPSVATIRAETGYKSNRAIVSALAGLKAAGIISAAPGTSGRGHPTKWTINNLSTCVQQLTKDVDNGGEVNRDTVSADPDLPIKGEVTSKTADKVNPDTLQKGEVTSKKGEVTSTRIYERINKEVSKSVSVGPKKGEVSSPFPSGQAGEGNEKVCREPRAVSVQELFPEIAPNYLEMCAKLGWRPNDPSQTPPGDAEAARRAVVSCAYRVGLSPTEAKKFLRYNAKRKWAAIDQASCVKDLAKEFLESWKRRDPEGFKDEVERRREAERRRTTERERKHDSK